MKLISLTRGFSAIVDDDDFEEISKYKWFYFAKGYAVRATPKNNAKKIWMHRVISKCPEHLQCDHINGNKLDNQKSNLRHCTPRQNAANRRTFNRHGLKGIHVTKSGKFQAEVWENGKNRYLGVYETAEQAHAVYCENAKRVYGEFARV